LVTIRLYDAVPDALIESWKMELSWTEKTSTLTTRSRVLRKRIDAYQDAGYGACWLSDPRIAELVESSLLRFDQERYRLLSWCIMPNHLHAIIERWDGFPLNAVLHSWKSYIAHEANRVLNRSGRFWFREYYDRFIRNEQHYADAVEYVESNPVKAKLVSQKELWRWSSCCRRDAGAPARWPG
jgi:REP element-mobilizing transposase RayT